jgi:hypothetical protein
MASREAAALQELGAAGDGGFRLEPADWRYYTEKIRRARYDLDAEALRPYLPLERVCDGAFQALARAAAAVRDGFTVELGQLQLAQEQLEYLFRRLAGMHRTADRSQPAGRLFQRRRQVGIGPRHELQKITPGRQGRVVGIDQDPQGYGGGGLLGARKVVGQILGDLPAHEGNRPPERLLQTEVADHVEASRPAHRAGDVELTCGRRGQVHVGLAYIAPHVPVGVGVGDNRA